MKLKETFRLTRMIASYWAHWMTREDETINYGFFADCEGLGYYDGWNATFWYLLNVEWYRMQGKQFAFTGCTEPCEELRDFDPEYLERYYPI